MNSQLLTNLDKLNKKVDVARKTLQHIKVHDVSKTQMDVFFKILDTNVESFNSEFITSVDIKCFDCNSKWM